MKCPHCLVEIHSIPQAVDIPRFSNNTHFKIKYEICPSCSEFILQLERLVLEDLKFWRSTASFIYPRSMSRSPIPKEVPPEYAGDYREACLVLQDSPKASAALSRRCLQSILRGPGAVKKADLSREIEEILKRNSLPSQIAEALDSVRQIGNFAAHPIKSTSSGEIIDVEPGEAEWTLDVIESLFDFYFVQPAVLKKKRDALNTKLSDAGKPPMK